MTEEAPLPQRILDAAEEVLRRHGVEKTNVVDIARVLGMSHGNIYRHFPSKQALLEAVAVRWLNKVTAPLEAIAGDHERPASERLVAWFDTLRAAKRRKVLDDPELFRVHHNIVQAAREMVNDHIEVLLGQVEGMIAHGVAAGEFSRRTEPRAAARAFLHGMSAFHHPALIVQKPPPTEADAHAVLGLLIAGLRVGAV